VNASPRPVSPSRRPQEAKVFWFFFSKKNNLPSFRLTTPSPFFFHKKPL
jgi:hypothetical protein